MAKLRQVLKATDYSLFVWKMSLAMRSLIWLRCGVGLNLPAVRGCGQEVVARSQKRWTGASDQGSGRDALLEELLDL